MRLSFQSTILSLGLLALTSGAWAQLDQADPPEVPLGDVARSMRKTGPAAAPKTVIDNDNFDKMMQEADALHASHSTMLFSFDPDGKSFRVSPSPDVTCSLSFNAQATALISDPYQAREMPAEEIAKLSGPASVQGDRLQVSVFNGTTWRLDEIIVGLTILKHGTPTAGYYGTAKLIPASSETLEAPQKAPDSTTLYKMRAAAPPAAVTVFHTELNTPLEPGEEWHWAIVQAKGIPPRPDLTSPTSQPNQQTAPQH